MTDEIAAPSRTSNPPASEAIAQGSAAAKTAEKPGVTMIFLSSLGHIPSEEEQAEERRRWKALQSGLHPDTGKRLRYGDEKSLEPMEKSWLQKRFYQNITLYGVPNPTAYDLMRFHGSHCDPHRAMIDHLAIARDRETSVRNSLLMQQTVLSTTGYMDCSPYAEIHRQRLAGLDSLHDADLVRRVTEDMSADLKAITPVHDLTMGSLPTAFGGSSISQLIDHWRTEAFGPWSSTIAREAAGQFGQHISIMETEATRLMLIYGPSIAEQTRFLSDYQSNLGLWGARPLDIAAYQGADLLARIVLPCDLLSPLDHYQNSSVERLGTYAEAHLQLLEEDFKREPNPVFAWTAFRIAQSFGREIPQWVLDHLYENSESICELADADSPVAERKSTEAELVGKAFGFSLEGRGKTGRFAHARQIQRDREIYYRVEEWLLEQAVSGRKPKLSRAYAEVAVEFKTDATTIGRAYARVRALVGRGDNDTEE